LKVENRAEVGVHQRPGIPTASGINDTTDPDVMSMAAFVATSVSRKFRKSQHNVKKSPAFVLEGFLTKVRMLVERLVESMVKPCPCS
jgi:hypothetical protein